MTSAASHLAEFFKSKAGQVALFLLIALAGWRVGLLFYATNYRDDGNQIWAASYQVMALWGVLCGLYYARLWGGWKSIVGRANIVFALGLCGELFGQTMFSYFFYSGIDAPYPSIADIGFFASIPLYIYGAYLLGKAGGAKISLKSLLSKVQLVLIPAVMLGVSVFFFLRGYEFDWSAPLRIFLDFGYPLGDALYISAALLAFSLSLRTLGGIMRVPVMCFIVALVAQYIADFSFLYQTSNGLVVPAGAVDVLYFIAYFLMSVSLIQLSIAFRKIQSS